MADDVTDDRTDDAVTDGGSVPFWWIVLFLVLALGAGAAVVTWLGGDLVQPPQGAILPVSLSVSALAPVPVGAVAV